jgi:hypothetical protein
MKVWADLTESEKREFLNKQDLDTLAYLCSLIANGKKNVPADFYEGHLKVN